MADRAKTGCLSVHRWPLLLLFFLGNTESMCADIVFSEGSAHYTLHSQIPGLGLMLWWSSCDWSADNAKNLKKEQRWHLHPWSPCECRRGDSDDRGTQWAGRCQLENLVIHRRDTLYLVWGLGVCVCVCVHFTPSLSLSVCVHGRAKPAGSVQARGRTRR